jgi:hypothetical protein
MWRWLGLLKLGLLNLGLLSLLLLVVGCGPELSKTDLGQVVTDLPIVAEPDTPHPMPELGPPLDPDKMPRRGPSR